MTRRVLAFLLYLLILLAPFGLAFLDPLPSRGLTVDVSVALGFVSLTILGLQPVLVARLPGVPYTIGSLLRFHRHITLLAVLAAFAHPAILFATSSAYRPLLDVTSAPLRAQLGWTSLAALVLLIVTSVWRKALRLSYPAWQALHAVLAAIVVLGGLAHALRVGYYTGQRWQLLFWLLYAAGFLWLLVWIRLFRPLRHKPRTVTSVFPEPGGAVTITLSGSLDHKAGQFAWLSQANPLRMDHSPYTIASPPRAPGVEFTIRPVGPSSKAMRKVRPGDSIYLDGPHGNFTLEHHPGPGFVFLAVGVGVTPFLSILSAMPEDDPRPCWLFLGNRSERDVPGVRRLTSLAQRPNLTLVHVLRRPSSQWRGERGRIDSYLLSDYLPPEYRLLQYFVCAGDEVSRSLVGELRRLKVPDDRIHTEGFGFV